MIESSTTTPGTFVPNVQYVHDGVDVHIVLRLDLPEGTHIEPHEPDDPFLIPTVVTVNGLDEVAVGYPTPVKKDLGWNDVAIDVLEGRLAFVISGKARPNATVSGGLTEGGVHRHRRSRAFPVRARSHGGLSAVHSGSGRSDARADT